MIGQRVRRLADLGVRDIEVLANGERRWRAIQEARGGR
jgi:hypothetical protein